MKDIYTQKQINVIDFINAEPYRGQMLGPSVKLNSVNLKYIQEHYAEVMFQSAQRPVIYCPTGLKPMVIVGNHRQGATKNLLALGLLDKSTKIPVQFITEVLSKKELTKIALVSNQRHATGNSKEMQVLGESEAAVKLYKPIMGVLASMGLKNITRASQIQSTIYLAALFNYKNEILKTPKKITSHDLYAQRKTDVGSTTRATYIDAKISCDLRPHTQYLYKVLSPAFLMLDKLYTDDGVCETLGNSKQILLLMIMLSARGWIDMRDVKRSKMITYYDLVSFFTDKKYKFIVKEWLIDVNNNPENQGFNMLSMIRKVKKGLPLVK